MAKPFTNQHDASVCVPAPTDAARVTPPNPAVQADRPSVYYDRRWRRARAYFLAHNPLCVECQRIGRTTAANEVDHVVPHKGDVALFWDGGNWQGLCKPCHSRKTADDERPKAFKGWFDPMAST